MVIDSYGSDSARSMIQATNEITVATSSRMVSGSWNWARNLTPGRNGRRGRQLVPAIALEARLRLGGGQALRGVTAQRCRDSDSGLAIGR